MDARTSTQLIPKLIQTRMSLRKTLIASGVTLLLIGLVGIWSHRQIEKELKANLSHQLETALSSIVVTIQGWARERIKDIEVNADNSAVREHVLKLVSKVKEGPTNPDRLRNLPEQKWLRKNLKIITEKFGFTGFVIFDATGLQIASLLDKPLGRRDLMKRSDFVQRALKGESVLSVPFESEIPLPDAEGIVRQVWPTMFVATPIRDDRGRIVAVLSFRLRPESTFSHLLRVARTGSSGETYAFNGQGWLISQSRFDSQLKTLGLIPRNPDSMSILNLEVRDPGGDMTTGFVPKIPRSQQPWTYMAKNVLQKKTGWDVDGYNDYRGVPVVGAWAWLEEFKFGLTHEIDVEEALHPLHTLSRTFLILFGLLVTAASLGLTQFHRKQKAQEEIIQKQKQTEEVGQRMQSIFRNTVDGIVIIDEQGIIESFNPAAEKIFGYAAQEVVNQNVKILMPDSYKTEHDDYMKNYARTGKAKIIGQRREVIGLHKDGTVFPLELGVGELDLESGKRFTGIVRDITVRKTLENKMDVTLQEAEQSSQAKSQFLSQMSHELRTPMNAILGFAQILNLDEDQDRSSQKECVSHILKAGKHLMVLINEVLDLSRIESGKMTVSLEPIQLAPLVEEVLALSRPLALTNQITFIDRISSDEGPVVLADRVRLQQVMLNLISNAIKYNHEQGTVTLFCETIDKTRLRIEVSDTGPGISEEDQKVLFQPFTRLHAELSETEGTGIGLTIARELMELMKGSISVESKVGEGSTFILELPLSDELPLPKTPAPIQERPSTVSAKTDIQPLVLYIEDNPSNMFLVKQILTLHRPDVELLTTPRGLSGVDLAKTHKPELILLDMNLPGINGLEVFNLLKKAGDTRDIPVIAVSANALKNDIRKALDRGFKQYLTKPIDMAVFLEMLEHYMGPPPPRPPEDTSKQEPKPLYKESS